jgi:hypothetical protein
MGFVVHCRAGNPRIVGSRAALLIRLYFINITRMAKWLNAEHMEDFGGIDFQIAMQLGIYRVYR